MTDNPHQPFLDAIRANPDEDSPRLVYADWLEEYAPEGQASLDHAELIRLQCLIAREPIKVLDLRQEWRQTTVRRSRECLDATSFGDQERQYIESISVTFRLNENDGIDLNTPASLVVETPGGMKFLAIIEIDGVVAFCHVFVQYTMAFIGGNLATGFAYYVKQDDAEAITHVSRRLREVELIEGFAYGDDLYAKEIAHQRPVRGFVETIMPTWDEWRHWHKEILARHPIRRVELATFSEMAYYMVREPVDVGGYAPIAVPVRMLSLPHLMVAKAMRECPESEFATVLAEETIDLIGRVWPGITFTLPPAS